MGLRLRPTADPPSRGCRGSSFARDRAHYACPTATRAGSANLVGRRKRQVGFQCSASARHAARRFQAGVKWADWLMLDDILAQDHQAAGLHNLLSPVFAL
eukprot:3939736-Pyramimonas_sp.AAC.1